MITALYERLSRDDEQLGESNSITNQKAFLEGYAQQHGFTNTEKWRKAAAETINEALREYGFSQGFVDHRSYARQNVQQIPAVHEGAQIRMMEKRGIHTAIHARNLEITLTNGQIRQLQARPVGRGLHTP